MVYTSVSKVTDLIKAFDTVCHQVIVLTFNINRVAIITKHPQTWVKFANQNKKDGKCPKCNPHIKDSINAKSHVLKGKQAVSGLLFFKLFLACSPYSLSKTFVSLPPEISLDHIKYMGEVYFNGSVRLNNKAFDHNGLVHDYNYY